MLEASFFENNKDGYIMKLDYKRIGARIKERRKIIGISQAQLAETVDLSTKYISQIERGVRHLSLDAIADIAIVLDASVDMLLFGTCFCEAEKNVYKNKSFNDYSINEQDFILETVSAIKTILSKHKIDIIYHPLTK